MSTSLSKRLFAGMAAASLGLAVTACGGGDNAANVEYDDSVTIANNQFNVESNHLAVGSVATKSDKQSRRMSQLPIA